MSSNNKIAVVTGAAQGIGLAISRKLAEETSTLIMTDVSYDYLEEEVKKINEDERIAVGYSLDVGNEREIKNFFGEIKKKYGRLDILVNNAGISPKVNNQKRDIIDTPLEEWSNVLKINLTGSFLCCREALPLMIPCNWGRIVNISSQAGRTFSRVAGSHYAASKSGLIGFTRILANEYGKYGITANCVAPGRIKSPMVNAVSANKNSQFVDISSVKRLGESKEVAAAVSYLCSEEASYVTGTTLDVNGGMFMN